MPWCQRSEIIKHNPDGSFDAELEIGFKFLVESYVSHVELNRPKTIKVVKLVLEVLQFFRFSPLFVNRKLIKYCLVFTI